MSAGSREQYLAEMRGELARLLAIAERLARTGNDRAALAELQRETRKIQGAAGSHGFAEASRLAAGMEATVRDWASRPDDRDVDRGSLTLWFVTRLAAMLTLELPRRASAPRPKPTDAATPRRTVERPAPPTAPPPSTAGSVPRLIIRRPSAAHAPSEPPPTAPPSGPKRLRDLVPPAPPPEPAPAPTPPPPPPEPPPPVARTQELTWLVPPDEGGAPAPEPQVPLPEAPPPASEQQPVAAEPPPEAPPPIPEPQPVETELPPETPEPTPEPPPVEAVARVEPPAPELPVEAPAPAPVAEPPPAATEVAATVAEVIYVEDDPALAELLEYGLRARGYRFLSFRNGRDALRELLALDVGGTHPLLLLDVDLPALDGYSILEALQRERPGTYRVVFTTVHGTEDEQLRGLEAGALDYLVKPISLRVAMEKIKRWVGR